MKVLTHAMVACPQTAWAAFIQHDEGLDWKDACRCAGFHLEALLTASLVTITPDGMCVQALTPTLTPTPTPTLQVQS
jgi:hypothetical protein